LELEVLLPIYGNKEIKIEQKKMNEVMHRKKYCHRASAWLATIATAFVNLSAMVRA